MATPGGSAAHPPWFGYVDVYVGYEDWVSLVQRFPADSIFRGANEVVFRQEWSRLPKHHVYLRAEHQVGPVVVGRLVEVVRYQIKVY